MFLIQFIGFENASIEMYDGYGNFYGTGSGNYDYGVAGKGPLSNASEPYHYYYRYDMALQKLVRIADWKVSLQNDGYDHIFIGNGEYFVAWKHMQMESFQNIYTHARLLKYENGEMVLIHMFDTKWDLISFDDRGDKAYIKFEDKGVWRIDYATLDISKEKKYDRPKSEGFHCGGYIFYIKQISGGFLAPLKSHIIRYDTADNKEELMQANVGNLRIHAVKEY